MVDFTTPHVDDAGKKGDLRSPTSCLLACPI